jgi:hypothetical protein
MLSTEMLLAKRCLNERLGKEMADWATAQLELGRDGKYLRQLAGILGNESPSELNELFDRCAREQGLRPPKPEFVVILYAQELCRRFKRAMIDKTYLLQRLSALCVRHDMRRELLAFYLLDRALDAWRFHEPSHYYRGLTWENFDQALLDEIEKLMALPVEYEPLG